MAGHKIRHGPIYGVQPQEVNIVGDVSQPNGNDRDPSAKYLITTGRINCLILIQSAGYTELALRSLLVESMTSFEPVGLGGGGADMCQMVHDGFL